MTVNPHPVGALPAGAGRNDASAVSELYARSRSRRARRRPTCERCGGPAPRSAGYMARLSCLTLCDPCAIEAGFDPGERA